MKVRKTTGHFNTKAHRFSGFITLFVLYFSVALSFPEIFAIKISQMNKGKMVFAQLMEFLPWYEFDKCVTRYNVDY